MRISFIATRCRPRRSKRPITSPMRCRWTPSGLTRTRVRSVLTARKSDTRTSRDRLLELGLAAERSDNGCAKTRGEQPAGECAHLRRVHRLEARDELLGLEDVSLEEQL